MNALSLEEAEQEIYNTYQWFAREAPGVSPQEAGRLGELWRICDDYLSV